MCLYVDTKRKGEIRYRERDKECESKRGGQSARGVMNVIIAHRGVWCYAFQVKKKKGWKEINYTHTQCLT